MKVLIIAWYYYPKLGGAETSSRLIAREISKRGISVKILTSSGKEETGAVDGIKVIRTPHMIPGQKISKDFGHYLKNLIQKERFDLVHCQNISYPFNPEKSLEIIRACNDIGIPVIEHAHNAQLKQPQKTRKIIHSGIDKILCVSEFVKKRLTGLGVAKEKLETLNNFVDTELFNVSRWDKSDLKEIRNAISPGGEPIIFFPGRVIRISKLEIGKQKQFKVLAGALNILKKKGIKFRLAIPGIRGQPNCSEEKALKAQELISKLLNSKKVGENTFIFSRGLNLEEMPLAYAAADIVCMPSLNETFGNVFAEAQAMEKPIVAARSGAAAEVISRETGILIRPGDEKQLAKALERLLKDRSLRNKLGKNGRRRVKINFSKEAIIDKLCAIYCELLSRDKVYLVRHPETLRNQSHRLTGWENTRYSENGKRQFDKIVSFFKGYPGAIYSSDLPRCLKLAKAISRENKRSLFSTPLLRERNFKETLPRDHFEDEKAFGKRIKDFIAKYRPENCIIISHGGAIAELIRDIASSKQMAEYHSTPRDTLFLIRGKTGRKDLAIIRL